MFRWDEGSSSSQRETIFDCASWSSLLSQHILVLLAEFTMTMRQAPAKHCNANIAECESYHAECQPTPRSNIGRIPSPSYPRLHDCCQNDQVVSDLCVCSVYSCEYSLSLQGIANQFVIDSTVRIVGFNADNCNDKLQQVCPFQSQV